MSPPTEQLIRDYLNRLSVAARGQLGPDDRRALVNRTRDLIERKTGLAGPPSAKEVRRLLAGLGDPARLAEQERQRLAAVRGEPPEPTAGRSRMARVLRRDASKARSASWPRPVLPVNRTDLLATLLDDAETKADPRDERDSPVSASAGPVAGNGSSNGIARNGEAREESAAGDDRPAAHGPAQDSEPSWFMLAFGGREADAPADAAGSAGAPAVEPRAPAPAKPRWPLVVARGGAGASTQRFAGSASTAGDQPAGTSPAWQLTTPADPVVPRLVRRAAKAVSGWCRREPVEATAVALLGLGGAIYPPVWLLGAGVALASRRWDYKDKWLGLALPPLLTLLGIVVGVTRGGHISVGHTVHEAWVYGVLSSRIAAVVGASYLGWRSVHGRRPPALPPWNRPRNAG
jgi:hypothetical protein